MHATIPDLVLASSSRYRRELLARLRVPFTCVAPAVNESARTGETPSDLALRLADDKARAVAASQLDALVIGSDQVAELDGRVLGKPGSRENATAQLRACSGRRVVFHTALVVVDPRGPGARRHADVTTVIFRALDDAAVARYVDAEQPLDCAGSFKVEGFGIALFERIESDDPTALIGLPLIALARILRDVGFELP